MRVLNVYRWLRTGVGVAFLALIGADAFAQSIGYSYDVLNRLTQVVYADGTTVLYTYDAAGNRLTKAVTEPCVFTLGATSAPAMSVAGSGTVTVSTTSSCAWTATANTAFLSVTGGASGTSTGTVTYSVAANTTGAARIGTLTIAGQTFTVTQSGGSAPTITTHPSNATVASGTSPTFTVVASGDPAPSYQWQMAANSWVNLNDASGVSGSATSTLTVTSVSRDWSGAQFRAVVTNSQGSATSNPAMLNLSESGPIISTVAGNGTPGFSGDSLAATAAQMNFPWGVTLDRAGNLYIADEYNHRIRKVAAGTGVITAIAGSGGSGTGGFGGDGDQATAALLNRPHGVAVDVLGNVYIADTFNHRIRKLTAASGIITTVAGTGEAGFGGDGSAATAALLNSPQDVALDAVGNLYIVDTFNRRIRKMTAATGSIATVAGMGDGGPISANGVATAVSINPVGLALDSAGNLYFGDINRVAKLTTSTGLITTVAGWFSGGQATPEQLNQPRGVAVDGAGDLYISEASGHRVRKVSASTGLMTTVAGTGNWGFNGDGGAATAARLYTPIGLAVDGSGKLHISDSWNNRIRKVGLSLPDSTPPMIVPVVTGTLGTNGWYTSNVTVTWNVADGDSTVASQTACGATTISSDTAGTTLTCSATSAGGSSSQSITIKRDTVAPVVILSAPANGASYAVATSVTATFTCADTGGSGIASCAGTVANGALIDTSSPGAKTFVAMATDLAGLQGTATNTYTVVASLPTPTSITVTSVADALVVDGNCTLREAIQAANTDTDVDACPAGNGADTILLPAGTYLLGLTGRGENANATGDLDILSDLTITGAGNATTIVDGAQLDRVFETAPSIVVRLSDLTVRNGSSYPYRGGGLYSRGTTTLARTLITANTAGGSSGGGIANNGTLTLSDSIVSANSSNNGGGIEGSGVLTLQNSIVIGNTAGSAGGGGIAFVGTTLNLTNSTVKDNSTTGSGGGLYAFGTTTLDRSLTAGNSASILGGGLSNQGTMTLVNSTVSGNASGNGDGAGGGGIYNNGTLSIESSTIYANTAAVDGGGILNRSAATIKNSILAGNTANDCSGGVTSGGNNLSSSNTCELAGSGDISNTDPLVGGLGNNGGPTLTHSLLTGSPAIDAAGSGCPPPSTDQRGVSRPQGSACDIGAYERGATNVPPTFTASTNVTMPATSAAGAVVLFTANGSDAEDGTIPAVCAPASGSTFPIGATTVACSVTDAAGATAGGTFTVTVTARLAQMTTPAPGATLIASNVRFQWSAGFGVSSYRLDAGTASGASNLFAQTTGLNLFATITGLPFNGTPVYVRLGSLVNEIWQYNSYTYTASRSFVPWLGLGQGGPPAGGDRTPVPAPAELAWPPPASMLAGQTVEFRWTGGVGASQYWLFVGTTPGGTDVINIDTGTARSISVNNLPSDGRPVYVRLWSLVGAQWMFRDYTYLTTLPF